MVAATHCFDRDLMATLAVDNVDPISRAEASELIMASTLFKPVLNGADGPAAVASLLRAGADARVRATCPQLLPSGEVEEKVGDEGDDEAAAE